MKDVSLKALVIAFAFLLVVIYNAGTIHKKIHNKPSNQKIKDTTSSKDTIKYETQP